MEGLAVRVPLLGVRDRGGAMSGRSKVGKALVALSLLAFACGGGADDSGSGGGDPSVEIEAPNDGADVDATFTLELSSSVDLGSTDSGAHHVHVFFDGDDSEYEVVTSDTFEVTGLSSGEHEVTASLRNADHSSAGDEATVTVTVAGGGGGDGGEEKDDSYDY
jgi:hypothetical protein